jgi:hypothetical protein
MKDVSSVFDHFRESARGIWNGAFWPDPDFRNRDSAEAFDEIQRILFSKLVLAKLSLDWPMIEIFRVAIPFFLLVPTFSATSIMIQRSESERGYWDHPVRGIKSGEARLQFVAYFDWNSMDYLDLRYYRVKIASFSTHPDLVGREALLERQNFSVYLATE